MCDAHFQARHASSFYVWPHSSTYYVVPGVGTSYAPPQPLNNDRSRSAVNSSELFVTAAAAEGLSIASVTVENIIH